MRLSLFQGKFIKIHLIIVYILKRLIYSLENGQSSTDLSPKQITAAQSGTPDRTLDPPVRNGTMTPQAAVSDPVLAPEALEGTGVPEVAASPPIGSLESVLADEDPVVPHLNGQGLQFTVGALLYADQAPVGAAPPGSRDPAVVNDWPWSSCLQVRPYCNALAM